MITLTNADAYFATHARADHWTQFSATQRHGAIEAAKRDLSRELRRPMREDEPPFAPGDATRDEYACYEQALHALLQMGQGKARGSTIPALKGQSSAREDARPPTGKWGAETLRWLGCQSAIVIRG